MEPLRLVVESKRSGSPLLDLRQFFSLDDHPIDHERVLAYLICSSLDGGLLVSTLLQQTLVGEVPSLSTSLVGRTPHLDALFPAEGRFSVAAGLARILHLATQR